MKKKSKKYRGSVWSGNWKEICQPAGSRIGRYSSGGPLQNLSPEHRTIKACPAGTPEGLEDMDIIPISAYHEVLKPSIVPAPPPTVTGKISCNNS